ncbi:hypothetical protein PENARI_c005G07757 [Penicillium arizonense]|uniref:Uncharacterized protein n=1 Tax=Penicillium arizonense TaxID=1835702 RepID=A0A1F5LPJ7_PENAI|nr:hypothetical protein PENARI_c005G07757 [Penicillium arizonense]OGE55128.1 hypothetical protein PENARI_c005G07757 [Penicillium arizonense]
MNHRLYVKRSLWGSQRVAEWHIFVDIRPNGQFKSLELVIEDPLTPPQFRRGPAHIEPLHPSVELPLHVFQLSLTHDPHAAIDDALQEAPASDLVPTLMDLEDKGVEIAMVSPGKPHRPATAVALHFVPAAARSKI